jgi:hypothetical protein
MAATGERTLRTIHQVVEERPWANERWLRRQIYEGVLGCYKVAGRVLIDLQELDGLVEAGRREARSA